MRIIRYSQTNPDLLNFSINTLKTLRKSTHQMFTHRDAPDCDIDEYFLLT